MSEEKKNLTEEERKELKEGLKKKIDEMSDEELDKVVGGIGITQEQIEKYIKELSLIYFKKTKTCPICHKKIDFSQEDPEKHLSECNG